MSGTIKIKFEGLNANKIINKLVDEGVFLKNIKEKHKYIVFEIDGKDEAEFKRVCKKYNKRYQILSKNTFVGLLRRTRFYFGFVLASVLIFAYVFSFNMFIFSVNVKVSSDVKFDAGKIENLLKENGIVAGMQKNKLDRFWLQNLILASDENVAGCSVKQNGGRLEIEILPAILKENVEKENIYSKHDAVISKINIFAGNTDLKVGDLVKQGDLLIENDNGAKGEIIGKVYFSDYLIYNENQQVKEYTGQVLEKQRLELFGKNLGKSKQIIKFSNYTEEKCVFYVSKYNFLPLKTVKTLYREFVYRDAVVKFSKQEKQLKDRLYSEVLKKLDEETKSKITNVTYSVVTEKNLTRLDCFVECEIDLIKN